MLLSLYKSVVSLSTPLLEAHLRKRTLRGKEDAARAAERRGRPVRARSQKPLVWFHAASVGESLSLLSIIARLLQEYPFIEIMVTTGTVTSAKLMAERLPVGAFHQYIPVDHPVWVARFLDHWRPDFVVWAESEFWPAMLSGIKRRGIPAVLLNARMSPASFRKWQWARGMMAEILGTFSLCFAQNAAEAERLKKLGAKNVQISANLKYAAAPLPFDPVNLEVLKASIGARPLVLWASTHPGEEDIAYRLHAAIKKEKPDVLTIIVPRHPVRGEALEASCAAFGLQVARRASGFFPKAGDDIYLADTLGELGLFYRLSKLAILGGSFADIGGHNPIEPGQLGCIIFYGPMMYNFITICADFESRQAALPLKDEADLQDKVLAYLNDSAQFSALGESAAEWTCAQAHIVDDLAAALAPWISALAAPSGKEGGGAC
jgi:3-deoxy-D-manno-octulosonic-acid transferase